MATYKYSGTPQFVTVSQTGEYDIVAFGAQGGTSAVPAGDAGGYGAEIGGDFELTAGEKLEIIVGGAGSSGGDAGGGGGGSFVLANVGGTYTALIAAGGGGGGAYKAASNVGGAGGAGSTAAGNGKGGAGGRNGGTGYGGGGGAGVKGPGGNGGGTGQYVGKGGSNQTQNYAGGAGGSIGRAGTEVDAGDAGGFGGGGGSGSFFNPANGGGSGGGGGGGGGFSGGAGGAGYNSATLGPVSVPGGGGGSYDGGIPITSQTVAGENSGNGRVIISPDAMTCFASGTRIRTTRGDVPVEALEIGDLAITASGARRPIRWIGHRTIDCRDRLRAAIVLPIRIAAHAFAEGVPARDLFLSPGHPVLVGADDDGQANGDAGHLVPIMCLINGTTIERVAVDEVTYWHVELDAHDILLAEGLPAESYLDWGDRAFFGEAAEFALANPDFVVPGLAGRCRPVALDGPVVEAQRRRLDGVFALRLAAACDWGGAESVLGF